jgi:hypothetical protein
VRQEYERAREAGSGLEDFFVLCRPKLAEEN